MHPVLYLVLCCCGHMHTRVAGSLKSRCGMRAETLHLKHEKVNALIRAPNVKAHKAEKLLRSIFCRNVLTSTETVLFVDDMIVLRF